MLKFPELILSINDVLTNKDKIDLCSDLGKIHNIDEDWLVISYCKNISVYDFFGGAFGVINNPILVVNNKNNITIQVRFASRYRKQLFVNLRFKIDPNLNYRNPDQFSSSLKYLSRENIYERPSVANYFLTNLSFCEKHIDGFCEGQRGVFSVNLCIDGKYLLSQVRSAVPRYLVSKREVSIDLYNHRKTFEQEWLS